MDGDTAYTARRKSLRLSWALVTSSFAFIVLLLALCMFFFFHPLTCDCQSRHDLSSTKALLNEIRTVDYEGLETTVGTTDVRLPRDVIPESYRIRIIPYLWLENNGNSTFEGRVDVVVNVKAPIDNITLHAVDMNMTECLVTR